LADHLVIDANPIISALLGGKARKILFSSKFQFFSTQHSLFEVEKYLPVLAKKIGLPEEELFRASQLLPITVYQPIEYDAQVQRAFELIGHRDAKDAPILALALHLGYPLWSDDRDFEDIPELVVRRTAEILATTF
jgi:predicted nucleic acid-binding protein